MREPLIVGGVEVSIIAYLDFDQSIEEIGGSSTRRMASGELSKMTRWRRHRITLSAGGWLPAALGGVDYGSAFVIELPVPVALMPGELLPDGWEIRVEKMVTDQSGASVRLVWPKMTVVAEAPRQANGHQASPTWELTCETV